MTAAETLAEWKAQAEREGIPWAPFEDALRKMAKALRETAASDPVEQEQAALP